MRIILALVGFSFSFVLSAQTITSNGTGGGPWNVPATWSGGVVPTSANSSQIRVVSGDVVTVPNGFSVQIDQFQIRQGGQLTIDNGGLVDVVNASGNDFNIFTGSPNGQLVVNGTLELSHGATIVNFDGVSGSVTDASTVTVNNGGVYRHKYSTTGGTILGALWEDGSTVEITGYTTNTSRPLNLNQAFSNFTWNCTLQTGIMDLKGNLTTVNGNLNILSTGGTTATGKLRFFYANDNIILSIGGDLTISGPSGVWFTGYGTGNVVNIAGDLNIENTINQLIAREGNVTINCNDLNISDPSGTLSLGAFASSFSIVNLSGNLNTIGSLNTGSGSGDVNFTGSSPTVQSVSGSGTIGKIDFTINSGAIVDVGTSSIRGTGSLTVNSGAELRVGDLNVSGAIQNSTTVGNIRVPVTSRTYDVESTIVYNGAGTQYLGSGHPIVNTVIQTNATLLQNNLTINDLLLESGTLSAGNRTLNVNGDWVSVGGVFNPGTGAVIFNGTTNFSGGPFSFNALQVGSLATLNTQNVNFSVASNFAIFSNNLNSGTSTITFNGSATQTVRANGNTLHNVIINKTGGDLNLNNSLPLTGVLTIQSSTILRTYGFLTLLSTNDNPAQDASIAALPDASSIIGNVTVQRYMQTADNFDRFLSMPISNATVAQLQDDFSVTGDFTGTSYPCTGCTNNGPSLERYNEAITGIFSKGYTAVPAAGTDSTAALMAGVGYDSYMWNGVSPITWDATGTINRGTINFTVSHTASSPAEPSADGWNLVGNPYPSAIQWNNGAGWSRTNIDPTVWVWDVVGRVWHSYNANTQTGDLTDGIIATGQGFWVYAPTPGVASMSINEQAKSTAGSGSYYRQSSSEDISLKVSLSKDGVTDNAFLIVRDEATHTFDTGLDCPKLELGIERMHISLVEEGKHLAYYAVNNEFDLDIPVRITAEESGNYELNIKSIGGFSALEKYYLVDLELEKSIPLSSLANSRYSFQYEQGQSEERFLLTLDPLRRKAGTELTVDVFPNPTTGDFSVEVKGTNVREIIVLNNAGIQLEQVFSFESSDGFFKQSFSLSGQPKGIYLLKIVTDNTVIVRRISKN